MTERRKKLFKILLALIIVALSVYYTVKGIDLVKLWDYLINANYIYALIPIPLMLISHWVRAMRWRTMLEPVMKVHSTWNLFSAVMVGYAFNNVLPRGGEFLRPYVYARREKASFSTLFATIVVERIFDLFTLLFLFFGVFFLFREELKQAIPNLHIEKLLVPTLIVVLVIIVFSFWPPFIKTMLKWFIKPISIKFYEKLNGIFDRFVQGFAIIRHPKQYVRVIIESLSIWLFYTLPNWIMFYSFPFQSVHHLGLDDAVLLIVISGIGFTVAPTPGALGVYHLLIQGALVKLYGISPEEGLAYATVTHGINYLVQVIVGGFFILRENIKSIPDMTDISTDLANGSSPASPDN